MTGTWEGWLSDLEAGVRALERMSSDEWSELTDSQLTALLPAAPGPDAPEGAVVRADELRARGAQLLERLLDAQDAIGAGISELRDERRSVTKAAEGAAKYLQHTGGGTPT